MCIDVLFPARFDAVPADHLYALYSALSHAVAAFHAEGSRLRFAPLTGVPAGRGLLAAHEHSHLRVRLPDDQVRTVLPLAGRRLALDGHALSLGVPHVAAVIPAATLVSRVVTFKNADSPEQFLATARMKLAELGVTAEPGIPLALTGPHAGEPKRKVVRIAGQAIVGHALRLTALSAADSLKVQDAGLGGRTKIGCGFFLPAREGE
jgi:CRISPR-associated endonuclease/helicase Cas3